MEKFCIDSTSTVKFNHSIFAPFCVVIAPKIGNYQEVAKKVLKIG
nr:MAG TPA: hypothetical protein [Caudoviricetes sp.]